ncbi:MAG: [FeFe] hydrogenase, group A [Acidobacteriota bacterium]
MEAVHRGAQTTVGTFLEKPMADVICINCGQCINRCPTGALTANDPTDLVWAAIDDPSKHVVIQTAPSPRAAIGECFGLPPGTALTGQMNTALRLCGFDRVFDTNFTADLTVVEEGTELLLRLRDALTGTDRHRPLPQFTSCSPGWVKYLEHFFPHRIPHLSSAKSPQQMLGALVKTHYARKAGVDPASIVSVALMPCTAKKFECNRPEMCASGFKDVDFGLTTREMAGMFKEAGIDLPHLSPSPFDLPFGTATGSGVIFGATGGVMESALRAVLEIVTGERIERFYDHARIMPVRGFEGIRTFEIPVKKTGPVPPLLAHLFEGFRWLEGAVLKVAVCHGTANARRVLEDIEAGGPFSRMHFIEFMACPGGCLGGGGMPIPTTEEIRAARARAIYAEDERSEVRKSHENPAVAELYREFLVEGPCGATSHRYLHTTYTARRKYIL